MDADGRPLTVNVSTGEGLTRCPICSTGQQARVLYALSGLSDEMRGWTFANSNRPPKLKAAYEAGAWLAENPSWWLTLQGPNGIGKTRLMACIVNAAIAAGRSATYVTTPQVLDHLRSAYAPNAPVTYDGMWERLVNATVLCLDEVNRWNPTAWAQEKFFQLLDERYRDGAKKLTVFSYNGSAADLPDYMTSRMRDGRSRYYELTGPDLRKVQR